MSTLPKNKAFDLARFDRALDAIEPRYKWDDGPDEEERAGLHEAIELLYEYRRVIVEREEKGE